MVRTGAYAYVNYGYESTFGGSAGSITNSFGQRTAVSSLTLNHNKMSLGKLGQVDPTAYAYGTQSGSLGINFVLGDTTSHNILKSIYGAPSGSPNGTSSNPYIYGSNTEGAANKTLIGSSFTTEIGFNGETDYMVRTLKGCVTNSLALTTTIGGTVDCTADIVYGKEDAPSNTSSHFSDDATENSLPFTFAHGSLKLGSSASPSTAIAELQDVDLTFTQNSDLLYELGSQQSVAGIKRSLDITGRFRAAFKNDDAIDKLFTQLKGTSYAETIGGSPEFELFFTNGASSPKTIKIEGFGLGFNDHSVSGLEPVEPVFEEINWQIQRAKITAVNA
tara:strand:- start:2783 stop:3781 length:999 start_codon:yes stop_codon:yes gene_type:complete